MPDVPLFLMLLFGVLFSWIVFTSIVCVANYRGQFTLRSVWLVATCLCVLIGTALILSRTIGGNYSNDPNNDPNVVELGGPVV